MISESIKKIVSDNFATRRRKQNKMLLYDAVKSFVIEFDSNEEINNLLCDLEKQFIQYNENQPIEERKIEL